MRRLRARRAAPRRSEAAWSSRPARFYPVGGATPLVTDTTLVVTQAGPTLATGVVAAGSVAPGTSTAGLGYFSANSFNTGGFGSLTLKGVVQFSGPVTLSAPVGLTIGTGGIIFATAAVTLTAPYVALGMPFQTPLETQQLTTPFSVQGLAATLAPTYGAGSLNVTATDLIDVGNLSLQTIGSVSLLAGTGDIRGDGTMDVAGHATLQAGQIYPPTEVNFTVAAYNYVAGGSTQPGSIAIAAGGPRALPLSAGGELNLFASVITQGGTLRAPIGTINLGWDGPGDRARGPAHRPGGAGGAAGDAGGGEHHFRFGGGPGHRPGADDSLWHQLRGHLLD